MRTEPAEESTAAAGGSRRSAPSLLLAIPRWVIDRLLRLFGFRRRPSDNPNIYPFY